MTLSSLPNQDFYEREKQLLCEKSEKILCCPPCEIYTIMMKSRGKRIKRFTLLIPSYLLHLKITVAVICLSQTFVSEKEECKHGIEGNLG